MVLNEKQEFDDWLPLYIDLSNQKISLIHPIYDVFYSNLLLDVSEIELLRSDATKKQLFIVDEADYQVIQLANQVNINSNLRKKAK